MDIPMIIQLQFGFSQYISFREEDLWNFSQSEHIIGPGSHVEYPTGTKNRNFVEDHPRNIPAKFGSNWPSGFGEEATLLEMWKVYRRRTTDDGRQVMAIVHMDLWSRWTKKLCAFPVAAKRNCQIANPPSYLYTIYIVELVLIQNKTEMLLVEQTFISMQVLIWLIKLCSESWGDGGWGVPKSTHDAPEIPMLDHEIRHQPN
jgi:hypothetical protein